MPRTYLILLVTTLILKLVPCLVYAQEEEGRTWSGEVEVSFVGTSGNSNTKTLGLGARFDYAPRLWLTEIRVSFIRSEADDAINARSLDAKFRGTRALHERFGVYTKGEYLSDRFAGIDGRYAVEGGISYSAIPEGSHILTARGGIGGTLEFRATTENRSLSTANVSATYAWAFSDNSALTNDLSTTVGVRDQKYWRLMNDFSLLAGLNNLLSLKLSYQVSFLNDPVPGFEKTDVKVSAAVVARF